MTKRSTKSALLSAVLAVVLCFSALLGTTFAWFTDSAVSSNNKIVAGNLDIELYQWTSADESGRNNISEDKAPIFSDDILWEPGMTEVVYLSIKNLGTLAAKYKVAIVVTSVSNDDLTEVMSYTITPDAHYGDVTAWAGDGIYVGMGPNATDAEDVALLPNEEHFFALSVHMDGEETGNEYMGESITFDIQVLAGQLASEEDSFGNGYDADATYPILSPNVVLPDNATASATFLTERMEVSAPAALLNGLDSSITSLQLGHTAPQIDTNAQTIVFDSVEFFDQNGNIVDLSGNTENLTVSFYVGDVLAEGDTAKIFHDDVLLTEATVDADGYITYTATHFCSVAVTKKINVTVLFSDGTTMNFNTLSAAMSVGYSGGEKLEIIVNEDITEEMGFLEGNIVCGKEGGVTIKNTIVDNWIYCDTTNFTIGEGVTYDASGYASGLFVYGNDCVINGTVITDCYYQRYANTKLTINAPGSMTVKTETFILRLTDNDPNAGIYINGDGNDETVEFKLAVAYFYQGMINAKDATLSVGTYWQTNETDGAGSTTLVLDNSKLTVTVNEHDFKATGNAFVTLKNGSVLNCAGGIVTTNPIDADETSTVIKAR